LIRLIIQVRIADLLVAGAHYIAARILLHEWTHLPYTLNTNAAGTNVKDYIGWEAVSSRSYLYLKASKTDKKKEMRRKAQISQTETFGSRKADSYAQFAVRLLVLHGEIRFLIKTALRISEQFRCLRRSALGQRQEIYCYRLPDRRVAPKPEDEERQEHLGLLLPG
jgi:hypothetical protein